MGRGREPVLKRGEQIPGAIIVPPGQIKGRLIDDLRFLATSLAVTQKLL